MLLRMRPDRRYVRTAVRLTLRDIAHAGPLKVESSAQFRHDRCLRCSFQHRGYAGLPGSSAVSVVGPPARVQGQVLIRMLLTAVRINPDPPRLLCCSAGVRCMRQLNVWRMRRVDPAVQLGLGASMRLVENQDCAAVLYDQPLDEVQSRSGASLRSRWATTTSSLSPRCSRSSMDRSPARFQLSPPAISVMISASG